MLSHGQATRYLLAKSAPPKNLTDHYGLPALATFVAERTPPAFEIELGRKTLEDLDDGLLQASELPRERQRALRAAFEQQVAPQAAPAFALRLEFRASKAIGANALALPGGIVVLIDDIVELADHDEELLTVLAHEVGHVVGRHDFKQLLEGLGITLMMTAITGDLSGPASLAAALPALLLRLEEEYDGLRIPSLLSTHPSSKERSRAAAPAR